MEKERTATCVICGEHVPEDEKKTVNQKDIQILVQASIKRKDGKHNDMKNLKEATTIVHNDCQTVYVRDSGVLLTALKKLKSEFVDKIDSTRRRSQRLRPAFNFAELCLFCEEDAAASSSSDDSSNQRVFKVSKAGIKEKLLEEIKNRPSDDPVAQRLGSRIQNVADLVKAGARYHSHCFARFYDYQETLDSMDDDYPLTSENSSILRFVIDYILDHKEECQFSLTNLFKTYPLELNTFPTLEWLRDRLCEHFGDDIVCHELGDDIFVCYRDVRDKIPAKESASLQISTRTDEERRKVLDAAADILFEDARARFYPPDGYKASNYLLRDDGGDEIPESLKLFFERLVKRNKKPEDKWDRRATVLAHATMASVRPRSFLSSLQVRLSSTIYKKFGSKSLVDALSYLGLCASHDEFVNYEAKIAKDLRNNKLKDNFGAFWHGDEEERNGNGPTKAKKRKIQQ